MHDVEFVESVLKLEDWLVKTTISYTHDFLEMIFTFFGYGEGDIVKKTVNWLVVSFGKK